MPLPSNASTRDRTFAAVANDVTIEASSTHYELRKKPRGRVVRVVTLSGDEYSKHTGACSPLTNLQRAIETGKLLGWLDPSTTIHTLTVA